MPISKKIVINNTEINLIETNYNENFLNIRNKKGRTNKDYYKLSDKEFINCLNQAQIKIRKYNKTLEYIFKNNEFKYHITLSKTNKLGLKRAIDRIKKTDKDLSYVSLASWTIETDLHYHMLVNTRLTIEELNKKLKNIDSNITEIYSSRILKYLKKNINYDTLSVLRNIDKKELKDKQIEILEYSKILSYSKDIKYKPIEIKNPTEEQIEEIKKNTTYLKTIEYKKVDSNVIIEKFEKC
ncbi:hypothetical protein VB566_15115 [Clostridium perfringens]|uniref:hypothetical protein n=1 Tax=Clostridium perfringens TaxID=1502 RepID=UPI0029328CF2|nr:hypothetical protein [Clostridium perfringens]ELP5185394.1 hypothetical protein [Clostridium perfringens]ELP5188332.1 hypothetical protein [Clostridium perfringens]MEA5272127.1 hypothetical protein [Clostridium perfringens]MEA5312200.1 hypothetical protein [Clostridium perfringens]MEA5342558.1 hypothetical protein [Clostridium perfringens]